MMEFEHLSTTIADWFIRLGIAVILLSVAFLLIFVWFCV